MCPWSCSQINKYPSFSRYSYDPKYPLLLHHLYTTHVWPVVCSISVAFAFLPYYLLPFPDPHTCGHVHIHIHTLPLKKKKEKKGYSSNLAQWSHHETMYCFPSLGVGGNFSGNLRETLFLSLWIILWGCTSVLLERTSGCNEGDKTYYRGWKPEFCDLV